MSSSPGRKKSSALPVRSAMNAESATPAKPARANCSVSRRASRITVISAPTATATQTAAVSSLPLTV